MQGMFPGTDPGFARHVAASPFVTNDAMQEESISAPLPMDSLGA